MSAVFLIEPIAISRQSYACESEVRMVSYTSTVTSATGGEEVEGRDIGKRGGQRGNGR